MLLQILSTIRYVLAFTFNHDFRRQEMESMVMLGAEFDDVAEMNRRRRMLDQALQSAGRG